MRFLIILLLISFNSIGENKKTVLNQTKGTTPLLIKHTLSAGGGKMSGSNYVVISSIGQLDAGHIATGGGQQFIGGILAAPRNPEIFKDGFE
ncbi:MAG: hypothetical protein QM504_14195 [Pseudomonadota bacterium]